MQGRGAYGRTPCSTSSALPRAVSHMVAYRLQNAPLRSFEFWQLLKLRRSQSIYRWTVFKVPGGRHPHGKVLESILLTNPPSQLAMKRGKTDRELGTGSWFSL